jgi:hypothetical protein
MLLLLEGFLQKDTTIRQERHRIPLKTRKIDRIMQEKP